MNRMRFAVDAHAIGRNLTGNEVYVRSLLRAFAEVDSESEFFAYISDKSAASWVPQRFRTRYVAASPWPRLGWQLGHLTRQDRPNLLHVQYTAPLRVAAPIVVTVHDVSFLEHPEYFTASRLAQLRITVARTVRRAERIITVSAFSRDAILRHYDVDPSRIRIVPNAASVDFRVIGRDRALANVATRFGIPGPFILTVGDLQPRKNHIGLIGAFSRLMTERPNLKHTLVLTGKETWFAPKVRDAAQRSGFADRIYFTGFVSDTELLHLYNACECFVLPSFYEGFGIPILEAMACGRAVACSNKSAMPEVADGAGLLFDPENVDDMKRALEDLLVDPELRARKQRLGLQRAGFYSWQKSARATLDVYREVVSEREDYRPQSPARAFTATRRV
jgi:glycosyltransferase involved in cell wall biosynthesis